MTVQNVKDEIPVIEGVKKSSSRQSSGLRRERRVRVVPSAAILQAKTAAGAFRS